MISIILNAYDTNQAQRHMTMACLAAIRKFTDPPYEIVVVDNEPQWPIRDEYNVLSPYQYLVYDPKLTVYKAYNVGAGAASGDILVFMQNDVFVHEQTINKLVKYLVEYDVAFPQQIPLKREQILELYRNPLPEFGWRDAGMLAITKSAFAKTGGWDGRYRNLLGEAAFYNRMDKAGLTWTCQTDAIITHIMAGNNLQKDKELYDEEMAHDATLLKEDTGRAV